jgi:uncharacterized protein with ATP-grasp and redox domains
MKSGSICYPCFMEQAHSSVMYAVDDEARRWEILRGVAPMLADLSMDQSPAYNSSLILHRVAELIGDPDPYAAAKKAGNDAAMAMLPALREKIKAAADKLETAVRLAVVGNVIDLGIKHEADLDATVEQALGDGFARFDYDAFKHKLASAKRILYVLDNAGEIVFDKLLMDGLKAQGKMVLAAVKAGPILNDALMADARQVGLDKAVKVIDTGNNFVGVVRDKCSEFFLKVLDTADMVIAKGQGNYETLDDSGDRFFFILKAKCPHVADALGVKKGDLALVRG